MILSDRDIFAKIDAGEIQIESPHEKWHEQIHASSMDLRLGNFFRIFKHSKFPIIDPKSPAANLTDLVEIPACEKFIVQPGEFILGVTAEKISLPDDIVARVEGRSSLGRLGIVVHSTAGFIDAGFCGTITLEISNLNRMPVALYPGMRVCQLAFEQMSSPALVPYSQKKSQKYQNQIQPTESAIFADRDF